MSYIIDKKIIANAFIIALLSLLSACGSVQPVTGLSGSAPSEKDREPHQPSNSAPKEPINHTFALQSQIIDSLNKFVGTEEEIIKDYFVWINDAKDVLGIKVTEEEKSTIEKVSDQVLEKTKVLQTGLGVIGFGARIASYFGVPGAAIVADLASFEDVIKTARGVVQAVQPKNIQEKFSLMQDFVGGLKKNIFGLSEKQIQEAVTTLNSLVKTIAQGHKISQKISVNNDDVFNVLMKVKGNKDINISFLQAFWQRSVAENLAYLDMLYQMGHALFVTASEISQTLAQTLESDRKNSSVDNAVGEFLKTQKMIKQISHAIEHTTAQVRDYKSLEN